MTESRTCDVAVIGAGPAGIAAAAASAELGARTLVLDEQPTSGGNIWRHRPHSTPPREARRWLDRLDRSGAERLTGTRDPSDISSHAPSR